MHVIVAKAYLPTSSSDKTEVNHINGNKGDASVENLEWVTPKENSQHAVNTGLVPKPRTKAVVQYNKQNGTKIAEFATIKAAHEATGASMTTISLVCNNIRNMSGGFWWRWNADAV